PSIPEDVEKVVLRALLRDPGERYASAEALASAIRALEAGDLKRMPAVGVSSRSAPKGSEPAPPMTPRAAPAEAAPRYLAVMPFRSVRSGDPDDARRELIALGITETVSAQLARYPGILVVSPAGPVDPASFDLRDVARAAGADLVLRGNVQQ